MTNKKNVESNINDAIEEIIRKYGKESITTGKTSKNIDIETIPTGSIGLDKALGIGGIPRGRIIEIFGDESCVDQNTFVQYSTRHKNGKKISNHGGSIKKLYENFHKIKTSDGRRMRHSKTNKNIDFYVTSINTEDRVILNRIIDVVKCGKKECFTVITKSGKTIQCTLDHKFYIGNNKFVKLEKLKKNDVIYVHNKKHYAGHKKYNRDTDERKEFLVKYHPSKHIKKVGKFIYYKVGTSRIVYEAYLNKLSFEKYVYILNNENEETIDKFKTLSSADTIHHINHIPTDNRLENLKHMTVSEHMSYHAFCNNNNHLRFITSKDTIKSIKKAGLFETYDIKCLSPFNNYIANNIVVHNSGKTTLSLHIIAEAQKQGLVCAFIDAEQALSLPYAEQLGVNIDKLLVSVPNSGEEGLDITETLVKSKKIGLIMIDSVAALTPQAEIDGDMGARHIGLQARLMSQGLRKLTAIASKTNTTIIFINQTRIMIGMVYGDPTTTTGGVALKFYTTIRIQVRRSAKLKEGDDIIGNRIKIKIAKNKISAPFKTLEYDIIFGEGISKVSEVINLGLDYKIITKKGNSLYFNEEKLGGSLQKTKEYLKTNPKTVNKIITLIQAK